MDHFAAPRQRGRRVALRPRTGDRCCLLTSLRRLRDCALWSAPSTTMARRASRSCVVPARSSTTTASSAFSYDMTTRQKVNMYTTGLGEPLRTDVELEPPTNLQSATSLVQAFE